MSYVLVNKMVIHILPNISKNKGSQNILPNISKNKGNQTMKFGQLIDYHMRNIFLEKSYTKSGG